MRVGIRVRLKIRGRLMQWRGIGMFMVGGVELKSIAYDGPVRATVQLLMLVLSGMEDLCWNAFSGPKRIVGCCAGDVGI